MEFKIQGLGTLDLPREVKTAKGRWSPGSDPRVEVFLLKVLDDLRAGGKRVPASSESEIRKRTEVELLWLLERNGWGVGIKLPGFQVVPEQEIMRGPPLQTQKPLESGGRAANSLH